MRATAIKKEYLEQSTGLWVVRFIAHGELQELADFNKRTAQNKVQRILINEAANKRLDEILDCLEVA